MANPKYTLYGAQLSLFTGKIRSYLIYKGLDFHEVLATWKVYTNVIVPKTGLRFVPVVRIEDTDEYIQDTAVIIDTLEQREPLRTVMPTTPKQLLVAKLFELYADEWLLLPAMHYRWNKGQEDFLYGEFGKVVLPGVPGFMQYDAGRSAGTAFSKMVPKLGITERTIPAIEEWYEHDFLPQLDRHFTIYPYLLGYAASIGDFGLMGPLYAHLYRDPKSGETMRRIAPHVVQWVERMNTPVPSVGNWLPADKIPDTLIPILRRMSKEFFPVLESTVERLKEWKEQHPERTTRISRVVGTHMFTIGGVTEDRVVTSFTQWKLQRVKAVFDKDHAALDEWMMSIGIDAKVLRQTIEHPVTRRNNILCWEHNSQSRL